MCGIAGILSVDTSLATRQRLGNMTNSISHRGPDGDTWWISPGGIAGFGHRRLAVIEPGEGGTQPMHYLGRYTIVYNGEIYNYIELRELLSQEGYPFKSGSDTEVILAAYDKYKHNCCAYFDGMFAFAIWDEQDQQLFAARDRFGEKPFYYHHDTREFLFGSEMKAIRAVNNSFKIDPPQIINFLTLGHATNRGDNSESLYQGIRQLPPAGYLFYKPQNGQISISKYWELSKKVNGNIDEQQALEEFSQLFRTSVKRRLRSDVAIGTSLSGGLDSSSIVATICKTGAGSLKTFSAVFPGYERDETAAVKMINKRFNCSEHLVMPDAGDLTTLLPKLIWHQEVPITSASVFAQYKVFELAKQNGTVVLLDGQGADEILGGYSNQLQWGLQELYKTSGTGFRESVAALGNDGVPYKWSIKNRLSAYLPSITADLLRKREKKKISSDEFISKEYLDAYNPGKHLPGKPVVNSLNDILHHHTTQAGLNELLHYADRNSMAHGREVRLPFLNHELVEFVFSLPIKFKLREGYTKWILRRAMNAELPEEIAWQRKKIGFDPPQKNWMQDAGISEMIRNATASLVQKGILSKRVLHKKIQPQDTHAADNYDWRFLVTDLLMDQ